jgi:uncharacterized protein YjiS (DUF1127 family)
MGHFLTHAPQQRETYSITSSARASSIGGTSRQTFIARIDERALLEGLQEFELKEFGLTRQSRRLEVNQTFWRE